jgi:putative transport protein
MFLYGIGILYGRQFFEGLSGSGRIYNLLAFVAVVAGLLVELFLGWVFGIELGHTLGLYAGSMTSTAALQAALDVMQGAEPSIGYSVAYPFWRDRPNPLLLFPDAAGEPDVPADACPLSHGRDHH